MKNTQTEETEALDGPRCLSFIHTFDSLRLMHCVTLHIVEKLVGNRGAKKEFLRVGDNFYCTQV